MSDAFWKELFEAGWLGASWLFIGYGAENKRALIYRWIGAMIGTALVLYLFDKYSTAGAL